MKNCKTNLRRYGANTLLNHHFFPSICSIIMATIWLTFTGCAGLEGDQTIEPNEGSTGMNVSPTTTLMNGQVTKNCVDIGQEITDRNEAMEKAFAEKEVDLLYNNFWTPAYYQIGPGFDKDRDELLEQMISFYVDRAGELFSYELESYDRFVHGDNIVYDLGAYDNPGEVNGNMFEINGYYFIRWEKGSDGLWRIDKTLSGDRGNNTHVKATTGEGPVTCYKKDNPHGPGYDEVVNEEIADKLDDYIKALIAGNAAEAYEFYTQDFRNVAPGLDVDRDGLDEYYRQFFTTGTIVSLDLTMHDRFIHDETAYDFGYFEKTTIVDGVQSVVKNNYVLRWEKDHNMVWRIDRILNVPRPY